jgi:hypothetical protein
MCFQFLVFGTIQFLDLSKSNKNDKKVETNRLVTTEVSATDFWGRGCGFVGFREPKKPQLLAHLGGGSLLHRSLMLCAIN